MPYNIPLSDVQNDFPEYTFIKALTPSEQKAAFHVKDADGNELCLKIISPNYSVDRIAREIHALQTIVHPNVVGLKQYTFTSTPGSLRHFMVEEYVPGEDLSARITPGITWSRPEAAKVFAAICDGLTALEEKNIVHRDLKPQNVRIRPDDVPVIIDFGLARILQMPDLTSTGRGAGIGTPLYFAPEQYRGTKRDIDRRTDLFAVGVMLFQVISGNHPFYKSSMSSGDLASAVCTGTDYAADPAYVALPKEWKLIVGKLLEKERARRPNSAKQVKGILEKIKGI